MAKVRSKTFPTVTAGMQKETGLRPARANKINLLAVFVGVIVMSHAFLPKAQAQSRFTAPGTQIEGKGTIVRGVECRLIKMTDGRVFALDYGGMGARELVEGTVVSFAGVVLASSTCMQGQALKLNQLKIIR